MHPGARWASSMAVSVPLQGAGWKPSNGPRYAIRKGCSSSNTCHTVLPAIVGCGRRLAWVPLSEQQHEHHGIEEMTEKHSIADARRNLPRLIHEAEHGKTVELWTLLTKVETSCDRILIAGGANVEAEWEQGPAV